MQTSGPIALRARVYKYKNATFTRHVKVVTIFQVTC